jgi:hypothetical protein
MGAVGVDSLDERIGKTILELRKLTRGASLQFALTVGRIVVETLYDGDARAWRSRTRKDHALRALVARPDLPMSASALYRALAIFELSSRQAGGESWQHVGVSHLRAVLGLPEDLQARLLERAEAERWTAARMERETLPLRSTSRQAGGRKRVPGYVKSIRRIFELTSAEALEGLDAVGDLNPSELVELTDMLESARARLDRLRQSIAFARASERPSRAATQLNPRASWHASESDAAE